MSREAPTYHERRVRLSSCPSSSPSAGCLALTLTLTLTPPLATQSWNQGTVVERLGKDALSSFDECRLSLTKAVDPVCSRDGILYSREVILESLLSQKKKNKKKRAAYDRYVAEKALKDERGQEHDRNVDALAMYRQQMGASDSAIDRLKNESRREFEEAEAGKQLVSSVKNIKSEAQKMTGLKSYWVSGRERSDGKREAEHVIEKPDMATRCPATNKPLKMKDLVSVRFQKNKDGEYVDPVTLKALSNASKLVVLKDVREGPNVMTRDTYKRVVEPEGAYMGTAIDAETGVIELQSGGTGFASTNNVEAKKHFAVGSKMQRGASGWRTGKLGGLNFTNVRCIDLGRRAVARPDSLTRATRFARSASEIMGRAVGPDPSSGGACRPAHSQLACKSVALLPKLILNSLFVGKGTNAPP